MKPTTAKQCPAVTAQKLIGGKWKIIILYQLSSGTKRFNELHKSLVGITQSTLTQQLREMESDKLLQRKIYPVVPPKVEYSLTILGKKFLPILAALCSWGKEYEKSC